MKEVLCLYSYHETMQYIFFLLGKFKISSIKVLSWNVQQ